VHFVFPYIYLFINFLSFQRTDECVLVTAGMQADALALQKRLRQELQQYQYLHHKEMCAHAIAQRLSNILYNRRFFPYYTFNILVGFDNNGISVFYLLS
jgi:20S proteasome subunit beta 6